MAAPTFLDNPNAPDVFSTEATGFLVLEGNIGITFESSRVNYSTSPGPVSRVVIGRLVMPIPAAQRLALGLYDFLEHVPQAVHRHKKLLFENFDLNIIHSQISTI